MSLLKEWVMNDMPEEDVLSNIPTEEQPKLCDMTKITSQYMDNVLLRKALQEIKIATKLESVTACEKIVFQLLTYNMRYMDRQTKKRKEIENTLLTSPE